MAGFIYEKPFQIEKDTTKYRLLTSQYVKTIECEGRKMLKVDPSALELLANQAVSDVSFFLRSSHLKKLSAILDDPEATDNDRFVAWMMLRNSVTSAKGQMSNQSTTAVG
jgi:fumarate hydratase class I